MSPIEKLPDLNWSDQARKEIVITGEGLLALSDWCWRLGDAAVVGLIYTTLTSPPHMWFALSKDVTMRDLIDFRRLQVLIPYGTRVQVAEDFKLGKRFAEFYGFEATPTVQEYQGVSYRTYRRT